MRSQHWARYLLTQGAQAGGLGCAEGKAGTREEMQPLWEWKGTVGKGRKPADRGRCPTPKLGSMTPPWPCRGQVIMVPKCRRMRFHQLWQACPSTGRMTSLQNGSHLGLSSARERPMPHCQHRPARAQGWVWSNNNNKNAIKKPKHDCKWDGPSRVGVSLQQAAWPSRWQPIPWGMRLCKEFPGYGGAPPSPPSPKRFMGTCWTQKQQQLIMVSTTEKLVAMATTSSTAALGYSPPFPGFSSGGG